MRLIDADALINFIDMGHYRNPLESCFSERDVVDMLESRPTIDAVEVVRCKDCKRGKVDDPEYDPDLYYCELGCGWNKGYFFCAYGKRRGEDEAT